MPTQPRKLFWHHWHTYAGGLRRRPLITFDWEGPAVWMVAGAWGVNEELTWGGPKMALDPGAWSFEVSYAYSGPEVALDAGGFTASESQGYAGPSVAMDPGGFSIEESQGYVGPTMALDPGAWSFEVAYPFAGPTMALDAGGQSFSVAYPYAGPSVALDPGTWTSQLEGDIFEGTQYVDGALAFTGATTIVFDPSVYDAPGNYVLFKYGTFAGGQAELDAEVTVDDSGLPLLYVEQIKNRTSKTHIDAKLRPRPTNGKQFVDGNLTFSGSTTIYLDETLYSAAQTFELFEVSGTVTGLANVTCISAGGLTCGAPFLDGSIVKVTLT